MYGSDNRRFGNINTDLGNNITCTSYSYPKSKENNLELINNYHVDKQHTCTTPVKEDVAFAQTNRDTKTSYAKKKG